MSGDLIEIARLEPGMRRRILSVLRDGPMSIPQVATALGSTTHEAMWWMMGCYRYGKIAPTGGLSDDGYRLYALTEEEE
jgi:hypothetical protein